VGAKACTLAWFVKRLFTVCTERRGH
jgi:hypothetical protein